VLTPQPNGLLQRQNAHRKQSNTTEREAKHNTKCDDDDDDDNDDDDNNNNKGKVHPRTSHEGPECSKYIFIQQEAVIKTQLSYIQYIS
jgi:hypothetical protein